MQELADARGRGMRPGGYSRIISLVPSWTESLFALGAGNRVVAVTDYCIEPRQEVARLPHIGGTKNPRVDEILGLNPDLVIANVEENRLADVTQLEGQGIPVWVTDAHTVRQAIDELRALGVLIGAASANPIAQPIQETYEALLEKEETGRRPRVFVAIWRDPWMTANGDTYIGDMLRVCGAENVFDERTRTFPLAADLGLSAPRPTPGRDMRYPRISVSEVVARSPDMILLPDEPFSFSEDDVRFWGTFTGIPAVQHGRVHVLDGKILSWYGVRMGHSMTSLRALLYGGE